MSTPFLGLAVNYPRGHSGCVLAARISENIKRLREERGWSRPQLGLRVSPPTSGQQIEKLEKGDRRMTCDWVERIANALGIDPAELLAGQGELFTLSEPVADEVAEVVSRIALQGAAPDPEIVQVISLLLQELSATYARYPQARRDPQVARPVIDLLAHRLAR
jgi:transcriptional regulator with XRE-family HTH domain